MVEDKEGFESAVEEAEGGSNSLIWFGLGFFSFFCFVLSWGEGVVGIPYYDGGSSSGVGNGYTWRSPPLPRKGQRQARCHSPSGSM